MIGSAKDKILNVLVENKGIYPSVTHSLNDALRGAIALLEVSNEAKDLALMPSVGPQALKKTARLD